MTDRDFWEQRWRAGQTGWHEADGNALLRAHMAALAVPHGGRVLLPFCGRAPELRWLAADGMAVVGVEWSETAVAGLFAGTAAAPQVTTRGVCWRHAGLTVWQADWFALAPADVDHVDAVLDRAALVAVAPQRRAAYVAQLERLAPAAPLLLVTLEFAGGPGQGPPFAVSAEELRDLFGSTRRGDELERRQTRRPDGTAVTEVCTRLLAR